MFLPYNELDLGDVNNNDSVSNAKKTKEKLKIGPSNCFHIKARTHKFLRKNIEKSKNKRYKWNQ